MEERVVAKRAREEQPQVKLKDDDAVYCEEQESSKRHKPYNHILSLLIDESEEESEDPTQQDLSPLITTLQRELDTNLTTTKSLDSSENCSTISLTAFATTTHSNGSSGGVLEEEDDDKEGVMRHLLEASDDELGIPNRGELEGSLIGDFGGDMFASYVCDDGLWELQDETANCYAFLHSDLFL